MSALGQGFPPSIQIGGDPGAADPDEGADAPDGSGDVESSLQKAKKFLQQAEASEQDHIDSSEILKAIQIVQKILASRQSGAESALGVTPAHKAMSRQANTASGGY